MRVDRVEAPTPRTRPADGEATWAAAETAALTSPLPPLLTDQHGAPIRDPQGWAQHREEFLTIFRDQVYGPLPEAPASFETHTRTLTRDALDGQAELIELTLGCSPAIRVLVIRPNTPGPHPVIVGINRAGNHTLLNDPSVPLPDDVACFDEPQAGKGTGRGERKHHWSPQTLIGRGYALATFHAADVMCDQPDAVGPNNTKALSAWAWGLHRAVDALTRDPRFAADQIMLFGHSRRGKSALWAAALDDRVAAVFPNMSGCMGVALSRHPVGEPFGRMVRRFPHWLSPNMAKYGQEAGALPVDQHMLVAALAPRPIMVTTAVGDTWADPAGQLLALHAALPAYHLLGHPDLTLPDGPPVIGTLELGRVGFSMLAGEHGCDERHWNLILDFADRHVVGRPATPGSP